MVAAQVAAVIPPPFYAAQAFNAYLAHYPNSYHYLPLTYRIHIIRL